MFYSLGGGSVLIAGGDTDRLNPPDPGRQSRSLRFTPAGESGGQNAGAFTAAGTVAARIGAALAVLPDSSVVVVGGARTPVGSVPTVPAAAADWVDVVDLFVPCAVQGQTCPP